MTLQDVKHLQSTWLGSESVSLVSPRTRSDLETFKTVRRAQ